MVYNSICEKCDIDIRKDLASSIVLSGGTSMIPGLGTRLEQELKELYVNKLGRGDRSILQRKNAVFSLLSHQVLDPPTRKIAVFNGASIYAKIYQTMPDAYFSKKRYEEDGDRIFLEGLERN